MHTRQERECDADRKINSGDIFVFGVFYNSFYDNYGGKYNDTRKIIKIKS